MAPTRPRSRNRCAGRGLCPKERRPINYSHVSKIFGTEPPLLVSPQPTTDPSSLTDYDYAGVCARERHDVASTKSADTDD